MYIYILHNKLKLLPRSGYMAPEYAVHGAFSVKSDVFSFGVCVIEIISGTRNRGYCHQDHFQSLLGHVSMVH